MGASNGCERKLKWGGRRSNYFLGEFIKKKKMKVPTKINGWHHVGTAAMALRQVRRGGGGVVTRGEGRQQKSSYLV